MHSRLYILTLVFFGLTGGMTCAADLRQDFIEPPLKYATRPLWLRSF